MIDLLEAIKKLEQADIERRKLRSVGKNILPVPPFKISDNSCWIWLGSINGKYSKVRIGNSWIGAHRYVYTCLVGDITTGKVLHHTCKNKHCVNPEHLKILNLRYHGIIHGREGGGMQK